MNTETVTCFLAWSSIINFAIIFIWTLAITVFKGPYFALQGRFFDIHQDHLESIHYCFIGFYKLSTMLLFLVPYIVLRFCIAA